MKDQEVAGIDSLEEERGVGREQRFEETEKEEHDREIALRKTGRRNIVLITKGE